MNTRRDAIFYALLGLTLAVFFYLIWFVFMKAPVAQPEAGGLAQKIFYFHVPSAYAMYLSGVVSCIASAGYLLSPSDRRDSWARAGAEAAVVFGAMVLTSGPLWAKKAWGVYWTWDPRLTTTLLSLLLYAAVVVLRAFAGDGEAERRFAAALSVLGTFNLPIIHYSVQKWGGNHPIVIGTKGGGLQHPDMKHALAVGFLAMTLLAALLIWNRARVALGRTRLARLEERLAEAGGLD
ncbi:MAG TPA: cytochrome c biogenesis protein CcsA [Polyangiaceae bacterium]|nr:cytochrome c biogenesis protein CcsA [Polyangiaceae bacterium]